MSAPGEVRVVDDVPAAFAEVVSVAHPRSIALSGGDTARRCYETLAGEGGIDWSTIEVLFGDERWVPVSDHDSNEGMARRALLDHVGAGVAVHSMREAGPTLAGAADAYDLLLRRLNAVDLVHLGLGDDGHTASLFPGSPSLEERERWVIATGDDAHPHPRLTFTLPAIAACRLAVVTVEGAEKRAAFAAVQRGDRSRPGARISAGRVLWLVAPDAAASPA